VDQSLIESARNRQGRRMGEGDVSGSCNLATVWFVCFVGGGDARRIMMSAGFSGALPRHESRGFHHGAVRFVSVKNMSKAVASVCVVASRRAVWDVQRQPNAWSPECVEDGAADAFGRLVEDR
jgi:hypothetical protein